MKNKPAPTTSTGGGVDVAPMIAKANEGVPANMRPVLDKVVLSGMRIMFDKQSHEMAMAELDKPGPLAERLSNGIIALMFMLWKQSNQTIPPQMIVPATLILTLRAFEFLQMSKDPEATKQVLGETVQAAVQGVMDRFKPQGEDPAAAAAPAPAAPAAPGAPAPAQGGMLHSEGAQ
jgi:hypothetical protein